MVSVMVQQTTTYTDYDSNSYSFSYFNHLFWLINTLTGNETLNGLAVEAANGALQMAEVEAEDVDLVIMCSSTPDDLFGGAAQVSIECDLCK